MHTPTAEDEHAIVVQAEGVPVIDPDERVREPPVELLRSPRATDPTPPEEVKLELPNTEEFKPEAVLHTPKADP